MVRFNFRRRALWLYSKIVKGSGTPQYIARGWAIGAFIGSVVPIFCQLVISIPLSFLLRGSKIGATLGTFHTNPVTVVFIYPVQCWVGNRLIGGSLSWSDLVNATHGLVMNHTYHEFLQLGAEVIVSFFVGGLLMAAILTPTVYFAVLMMVKRYRRFREQHPGLRMRFLPPVPDDAESASHTEEGKETPR